MPGGDIWPRTRAIVRRLKEIRASLDDSRSRLALHAQRVRAGTESGNDSTTKHTFNVSGSCWGHIPVSGADIYVYTYNAAGVAVLNSIVHTDSSGYAVAYVPGYNPATGLVPFAIVLCIPYAAATVNLPTTTTDHPVQLGPNLGAFQAAPSVAIGGSGTGATATATAAQVYTVTAPGTGYKQFDDATTPTTVSLIGSYSTGATAKPFVGILGTPNIIFAPTNRTAGTSAPIAAIAGTGGGPGATGGTARLHVTASRIDGVTIATPGEGYVVGGSDTKPFIQEFLLGSFTKQVEFDVIAGLARIATLRFPDIYGCHGTCGVPAKLTGSVSNQFGSAILNNVSLAPTVTQFCSGKVVSGTAPSQTVTDPGPFGITWTWARTGVARYSLVFSGDTLISINIVDPGYGYDAIAAYYWTGGAIAVTPGATIPGTSPVYHFTLDSNGSINGYVIDAVGSIGGTTTTATVTLPLPLGGEYELKMSYQTRVYAPTGEVLPINRLTDSGSGSTSTSAQVRASSYTCAPFTGSFDFTGTAPDGVVFRSGSKIATYDGS